MPNQTQQLIEFCEFLKSQGIIVSKEKTASLTERFITSKLRMNGIAELVATHHDMDANQVSRKSRKREIVTARQISMWAMWNYTPASLELIGSYFSQNGHRFNHSTVIHARDTVEIHYSTEAKFRIELDKIIRKIELTNKKIIR